MSCCAPDVLASLADLRGLFSARVGCRVSCRSSDMGSSGMMLGGGAGAGVAVLFSWAVALLLAGVFAGLSLLADGLPGRSALDLLELECAALSLFGKYMP